ncbi:MAG: ABC transporter substrate-binding protein [Dehalococcoidia bacterium]|nr:ABC transporter substrate-binding protein [Dehalococcoidia bacterium]
MDEIPPSVDDESYELDLELMLTLNPDVLIVSSGQEEDYERLTAAGLPVVSYNYNASWRERAQRVAELLGRPGALDDLIAELDERIDALTERAEGLSAAIVDFRGAEDIRVWAGPQNNRLSAYAVLDEIGLRPGEEIRSLKNEFDQTVLSLEQLRLIDTDYIYVFSAEAGDAAVNDENLRELVSSPLWESLPAVQAGNVHLVSTAWFGDSIRSVRTIIGDLEQTLPA